MLLSASGVAKAFGVDSVLTNVTFRIEPREKVALVGRNGTGKSTLLKIICGLVEADSGSVNLSRGAKIGYLRQEAPVTLGLSVIEEAEAGVQNQLALRARLDELESVMSAGEATADDLDEFGLLHEHFLEAEGYSAERDVRVVLQRMGFTEDEFSRPTDLLSGGERTRLAIARLLLEEPDLLILDEPTNHLDLQATEWLEGWIRGYHGAILLVSHDRTFLESTADRVLELRDGTIKGYPGPFDKYLKLKEEENLRLAEVAKRQDQQIAKLDEFVRRFMNSQRTAQARGRLKHMNRLVSERVSAPKQDKGIKGGFQAVARSGDIVLDCEKLTVGFDDLPLYRDLNWTVRIGERWGVIGENGAGKSTLLRVIAGELEPMNGRTKLGANVFPGFFRQDGDDLDPDMSPLDVMVWDMDMEPGPARDLLGRFLISGDDVFRPIKTMSGGEKNKLSLAKLTRQNPNLLILDEPTNHLDMDSREALAEVLKEYTGTLILVSHDRWLLSQVCEQTLDIRKAGPVVYLGSYQDYRARKPESEATKRRSQAKAPLASESVIPTMTPREISKELQRVARLVEGIEADVAEKEAQIKSLEDQLANVDPTEDVLALTLAHQRMSEELEGTIAAWEEQAGELERLQSLQGKA